MKINTSGVVATTIFVASMLGINEISNQSKQERIEEYKAEIAKKDSLRFKAVDKLAKNNENVQVLFNIWQDEHAKMNDSIKKLGLSQKAIFEGSQLIKK